MTWNGLVSLNKVQRIEDLVDAIYPAENVRQNYDTPLVMCVDFPLFEHILPELITLGYKVCKRGINPSLKTRHAHYRNVEFELMTNSWRFGFFILALIAIAGPLLARAAGTRWPACAVRRQCMSVAGWRAMTSTLISYLQSFWHVQTSGGMMTVVTDNGFSL